VGAARFRRAPGHPLRQRHRSNSPEHEAAGRKPYPASPKGMSCPLEAAPLGARLTLPSAGRPRRAPPSRWRLPQSRRLLAPDGVTVRVGERDDARAFDFPFQRRGINWQAAHEAPPSCSPAYRGHTRRCKQLTL